MSGPAWGRHPDTTYGSYVQAGEEMTTMAMQLALQQEYRINLSLTATAMIMRMFDSRRIGCLTKSEFGECHRFLARCKENFDYFDTAPRNGSLTRSEVAQALEYNSIHLEPPVFERCFTAFDPNQTGSMGMAEFIMLSVFIESCRATFRAFDKRAVGTVTMDFQQFVYAGANLR